MTFGPLFGQAPTRKQLRVLRAIERFIEQCGYAPSMVELGEELGIASNNGIASHLRLLHRKGLMTSKPFAARTWKLTPLAMRHLYPRQHAATEGGAA